MTSDSVAFKSANVGSDMDTVRGVTWDTAVKIASVLKSWHRPRGLLFVIGIDTRSPDDNRVFVSINLANGLTNIPSLVIAFDEVPTSGTLTRVETLIRGWFGLLSEG